MKNIAVIEGGYSHEKIISVKSAQTVLEHLDRSKYSPIRVSIDEEGWFAITDQGKVDINRSDFSFDDTQFDFAFIMVHGTPGEDGKLQAYFDMIGMPYSTCSHLAATLTFNKFVCNKYLKNFGIKVANAVLVRQNESFDAAQIVSELGLPCFVKPADGGSSFGVTKVTDQQELKGAIELALQHGTQAVIESFMKGREVTNGVYKAKNGVTVLPITEIVTTNDFFDFDAKYKGESDEITPADLTPDLADAIKSETKKIYELLDLDGICRADYILQNDEPYLIEINTVPGMSAESLIPQMAAYQGIALKDMLGEVIELNSTK